MINEIDHRCPICHINCEMKMQGCDVVTWHCYSCYSGGAASYASMQKRIPREIEDMMKALAKPKYDFDVAQQIVRNGIQTYRAARLNTLHEIRDQLLERSKYQTFSAHQAMIKFDEYLMGLINKEMDKINKE